LQTADVQALGPDFADESFHLSLFTFGPAYVKDPEAGTSGRVHVLDRTC
jgi:hypothetical protein